MLVNPDPKAARDPAWHQALVWVQGTNGGPGWALQCWEGKGSGRRRQPGVISFLLSSPSTVWGLEGSPLSPLFPLASLCLSSQWAWVSGSLLV